MRIQARVAAYWESRLSHALALDARHDERRRTVHCSTSIAFSVYSGEESRVRVYLENCGSHKTQATRSHSHSRTHTSTYAHQRHSMRWVCATHPASEENLAVCNVSKKKTGCMVYKSKMLPMYWSCQHMNMNSRLPRELRFTCSCQHFWVTPVSMSLE